MANKFSTPIHIERKFAVALRKVARTVGSIVNIHTDGEKIINDQKFAEALKSYSDALDPWAKRLVSEMVKAISTGNTRAFAASSKKSGSALSGLASESAINSVAAMLQARQVDLIKSLPLEAGLRAQDLARQAAIGGRRASEVAEEIARTEQVTSSRATLIARTEIAKANAAITQARAEYIGATHYIWHTAEDGDVRESHSIMEGTVHRFDQPPTLDDGMVGNPGEFPNCRCFAEPILPE